MIPIKLTLSGFLSYRQPVELDFTSFDVACISGANGAGKSSLLDGITWALFGKARRSDEAIINNAADVAEVSFEFEYESNRYRIMRSNPRGKTTSAEFQILNKDGGWKPLTERTLRDTQSRIEETLRMDYDTFINAAFFLQGKADQFTQQTAGKRKEILTSILGLEMWEAYRAEAAAARKAIEQQTAELEGRMQEITSELNEEDERVARLAELEKQLAGINETLSAQKSALEEMRRRSAAVDEQRKLVETLAGQLARAEESLGEQRARLAEREAEKEGYADIIAREKDVQASYDAWQASRKELERLDEISTQFNEQEKRRHEPLTLIQTEQARLEAERDQQLAAQGAIESAKQEQAGFESQQKELSVLMEGVQARVGAREELAARLDRARQEQAVAQVENPVLKAEMDELKGRIDQLEQTEGATCPLCGQPLSEAERAKLIKELHADGKTKGDAYRANQVLVKETDSKVAELEKQLAADKGLDAELRELTRQSDQAADGLKRISEQIGVWEKEGVKRLKELEKKLSKEDYAAEARKTLAAIDAELKKIGYDAASHDAARKQEQSQRASEDELRRLENARAALAPLEREIKELGASIAKQEKETAAQQKTHDDAAANLAAAATELPNILEAERKMLSQQEEENKLRDVVGIARQKVNVLADLKKRYTELEAEREEHARLIGRYKQLERAFGKDGVPAMLIEQALPQIENKANEILERLSSGNMHVSFLTQKELKDKKREDLKETLDIIISDSAGERDYEMYSGGEAFRINFAIRLALSEVLAQRAGARLQTLVIDEGFGSQDEAGRQRLVEAINLVKSDFQKILVITHIDTLKDAFPTRIEVEKNGNGSVVSVV